MVLQLLLRRRPVVPRDPACRNQSIVRIVNLEIKPANEDSRVSFPLMEKKKHYQPTYKSRCFQDLVKTYVIKLLSSLVELFQDF